MKWNVQKNEGVSFHVGRIGAKTWEQLPAAFEECWERVAKQLRSTDLDDVRDRILLCAIRPDSGRFSICPCQKSDVHKGPIGFSLVVMAPPVEEAYYELPDPDAPDFDRAHDRLFKKCRTTLSESLQGGEWQDQFANAVGGRPLDVYTMEYDDVETLKRLTKR